VSETTDGSLAADVRGLGFSYGSRVALRGLTFSVKRGEIFGFLGPNGSGKTTAFRVLSTLIQMQSGSAALAGFDLASQRDEIRRRIGVVFQAPSLDKKLTAYENLLHQGHLFGLHGAALKQRIAELLDRVKLSERANEAVEKFSGGMRRRVELAKALLHKPQMLILDEPSTGLDPGARLDLWQYLQQLSREEGLSCLLTTHYMEEAARCDRLLILNQGECVALGTPDGLRAEIGGEVITIAAKDTNALSGDIRSQFGVEARVFDGLLRIEHDDARGLVSKLAETYGPRVEAITMAKPTLDDVFIRRTGHRFWAEGSPSNGNGNGVERKRT
jgi:ABC-2 type transport system ATP-binding protein